jgi:hypothetical protein
MQLQSLTVSWLRRTTGRSLRGLADAFRSQMRHQERFSRPQREQAFPGRHGDGMPDTTGNTVTPPGQRQASEDTAGNHQPAAGTRPRRRATAMKPAKYQALVTLYPPGDGGLDAEPLLHVRRLAVRPDHHGELFSALVSVEDGSLLSPGAADIVVTMVVLGDDARDYLAPGEQFALLSGGEVGHGVVSGWLFT